MKQYAILTDTATNKPYGIVVKDGSSDVVYGAHKRAEEWARWANGQQGKSLMDILPVGIAVSPHRPLPSESSTFIAALMSASEKSGESLLGKREFMGSHKTNAPSSTPSGRDFQLRSFDVPMRQNAVNFKALAFQYDIKSRSIAALLRTGAYGYNIKTGLIGARRNVDSAISAQNRADGIASRAIQRKVGLSDVAYKYSAKSEVFAEIEEKRLGGRIGKRIGRGLRSAPDGFVFIDVTGRIDADKDGIVFEGLPLERPIIPRFLVPQNLGRAISSMLEGESEENETLRRAGKLGDADVSRVEGRIRELLGNDAASLTGADGRTFTPSVPGRATTEQSRRAVISNRVGRLSRVGKGGKSQIDTRDSRAVEKLTWDDDNKELIVTYNGGRVYTYSGVDDKWVRELENNPEFLGRTLNEIKKQGYPFVQGGDHAPDRTLRTGLQRERELAGMRSSRSGRDGMGSRVSRPTTLTPEGETAVNAAAKKLSEFAKTSNFGDVYPGAETFDKNNERHQIIADMFEDADMPPLRVQDVLNAMQALKDEFGEDSDVGYTDRMTYALDHIAPTFGARLSLSRGVRRGGEDVDTTKLVPEANLEGADLSDQDLQKINLDGAILTGADLNRSTLSGASFYAANLSGVNMAGAEAEESVFYRANLRNADMTGIYARRADFEDSDLRGADLSGADLVVANLTGADLTGANLRGASLYNANLSGADLRDADLRDADLSRANLDGAILTGANLDGAKLDQGWEQRVGMRSQRTPSRLLMQIDKAFPPKGSDSVRENFLKDSTVRFHGKRPRKTELEAELDGGKKLAGADLRLMIDESTNLSGADLRGADLSEQDLGGINLQDVKGTFIDLRATDLSRANLQRAQLPLADMRLADISRAKLAGADLTDADLRGAVANGADFRGVNLDGADLRGAILTDARFDGANITGRTKIDSEYRAMALEQATRPSSPSTRSRRGRDDDGAGPDSDETFPMSIEDILGDAGFDRDPEDMPRRRRRRSDSDGARSQRGGYRPPAETDEQLERYMQAWFDVLDGTTTVDDPAKKKQIRDMYFAAKDELARRKRNELRAGAIARGTYRDTSVRSRRGRDDDGAGPDSDETFPMSIEDILGDAGFDRDPEEWYKDSRGRWRRRSWDQGSQRSQRSLRNEPNPPAQKEINKMGSGAEAKRNLALMDLNQFSRDGNNPDSVYPGAEAFDANNPDHATWADYFEDVDYPDGRVQDFLNARHVLRERFGSGANETSIDILALDISNSFWDRWATSNPTLRKRQAGALSRLIDFNSKSKRPLDVYPGAEVFDVNNDDHVEIADIFEDADYPAARVQDFLNARQALRDEMSSDIDKSTLDTLAMGMAESFWDRIGHMSPSKRPDDSSRSRRASFVPAGNFVSAVETLDDIDFGVLREHNKWFNQGPYRGTGSTADDYVRGPYRSPGPNEARGDGFVYLANGRVITPKEVRDFFGYDNPQSMRSAYTGPVIGNGPLPSFKDLDGMTRVSGPLGSNGGQWYRDDKTGRKFFVKPTPTPNHAYNEAAVAAVYRAAGAHAPNVAVIVDGRGKPHIISEGIDGLETLGRPDARQRAVAKLDMGIDMALSNWDVYGGGENTKWDSRTGAAIRLDTGGGGLYRARGGDKPSFNPNDPWVEPATMIYSQGAQSKYLYGNVSNDDFVTSMRRVESLNLAAIDKEMADSGVPAAMRKTFIDTLAARQKMAKKYADDFSQYTPEARVNVAGTKITPGGERVAKAPEKRGLSIFSFKRGNDTPNSRSRRGGSPIDEILGDAGLDDPEDDSAELEEEIRQGMAIDPNLYLDSRGRWRDKRTGRLVRDVPSESSESQRSRRGGYGDQEKDPIQAERDFEDLIGDAGFDRDPEDVPPGRKRRRRGANPNNFRSARSARPRSDEPGLRDDEIAGDMTILEYGALDQAVWLINRTAENFSDDDYRGIADLYAALANAAAGNDMIVMNRDDFARAKRAVDKWMSDPDNLPGGNVSDLQGVLEEMESADADGNIWTSAMLEAQGTRLSMPSAEELDEFMRMRNSALESYFGEGMGTGGGPSARSSRGVSRGSVSERQRIATIDRGTSMRSGRLKTPGHSKIADDDGEIWDSLSPDERIEAAARMARLEDQAIRRLTGGSLSVQFDSNGNIISLENEVDSDLIPAGGINRDVGIFSYDLKPSLALDGRTAQKTVAAEGRKAKKFGKLKEYELITGRRNEATNEITLALTDEGLKQLNQRIISVRRLYASKLAELDKDVAVLEKAIANGADVNKNKRALAAKKGQRTKAAKAYRDFLDDAAALSALARARLSGNENNGKNEDGGDALQYVPEHLPSAYRKELFKPDGIIGAKSVVDSMFDEWVDDIGASTYGIPRNKNRNQTVSRRSKEYKALRKKFETGQLDAEIHRDIGNRWNWKDRVTLEDGRLRPKGKEFDAMGAVSDDVLDQDSSSLRRFGWHFADVSEETGTKGGKRTGSNFWAKTFVPDPQQWIARYNARNDRKRESARRLTALKTGRGAVASTSDKREKGKKELRILARYKAKRLGVISSGRNDADGVVDSANEQVALRKSAVGSDGSTVTPDGIDLLARLRKLFAEADSKEAKKIKKKQDGLNPGDDPILTEIFNSLDLNERPTVATLEELQELAKLPGARVIRRGIGGKTFAEDYLDDSSVRRFIPAQGGTAQGVGEYWAVVFEDGKDKRAAASGWEYLVGKDDQKDRATGKPLKNTIPGPGAVVGALAPDAKVMTMDEAKALQAEIAAVSGGITIAFNSPDLPERFAQKTEGDALKRLLELIEENLETRYKADDPAWQTRGGKTVMELVNAVRNARTPEERKKALAALDYFARGSTRGVLTNLLAPLYGYDAIRAGDGVLLVFNRGAVISYGGVGGLNMTRAVEAAVIDGTPLSADMAAKLHAGERVD